MYRRMTAGRAGVAAALSLAVAAAAAVTITPAADAASAPGTVTIGGKCLDDADFSTANGAIVQLFTCNGASAQNWTWQDNGSLTVTVGSTTKCLDVTGGSNADNALVQLYDCNAGAPQQRFKYLPDGTIYSAKSGKCLAVKGSVANNARIGLAPCDPAQTSQKWGSAAAPQPGVILTAGNSISFSQGDDSPSSGYTDADGKFYFQNALAQYGTGPRYWNFYSGANYDSATLDPISNTPDNSDTTSRCNNSPTGLTATATAPGTTYSQPNYCDLVGVWVDPDTGWWYGLVHNEFTGSPFGDGLHFDAIDSAVSKDHGSTWTIQDHALTSPYSTTRNDTAAFPNQTYYYGDGDQRLFVDYASGYFYVYYATRVVTKSGPGGNVWEQHVARAPISGKMAASSWKKWYNGAWQSPGVGGAESNIIPADGNGLGYIPSGEDYKPSSTGGAAAQVAAGTLPDNSQLTVMNIAWNAYLGKYIGTPQNNIAQNTRNFTPLHFYSTDDLATQKWTDMGLVPGTENASWYRWLVDSGNKTDNTVLGKTFRSYCHTDCGSSSREITVAPRTSSDLPSPVDTGRTYQIAAGNGRYLDQSGSSLVTSGTAPSQQWRFTATGDGFYTITNSASGQALGVGTGNAGRAWGAAVTLGSLSTPAGIGQQWSVQATRTTPDPSGASTPTGAVRLVNRYSGLALSLTNQGTQSVLTSPQRNWDNAGTGSDTRPANAQTLTLTAVGGTAANTVTVTNPGARSTNPGTAITPLQVSATDSAAGQTLTYTATGLPTGLTVNSTTGQITGTPVSVGTATVTVTATDTTGASGFAVFTWTVTGTDLAQGRPTTAFSTEVSTLGAALATDGKPATRWASAHSDPQWLQVDLGTTQSVKEVKLTWEAAYGKAYQIQTSNDGTTWTTIYTTTTGDGGTDDLTGLTGSGRYIRMNGTTRALTSYGYSLWSFQVYSW
ncbi:RICIN domain-containing protein [Kitasatospora sp. NBC_00240]|uniref:RICIN domain-containing protein n=1 Tax=Kitasatospora sp. NBC_00240 TaxID=2903567 RepID=UPI00224E6E82|nr:RICIN domain-containing protein [Kitasatospora sp. NBC_00240]MCX5216029.1 RICIN domain-containing protein [Kitasatospora sp. NBC_00240]